MIQFVVVALVLLAPSSSLQDTGYEKPATNSAFSSCPGQRCASSGVSLQHTVCYVRPDNSSSSRCPGQPCLTLDQYASQQTKYFTTGTTFLFMAGNHSITPIILNHTSNVVLKTVNDKSDVTIWCKAAATIQFMAVTNLTIQGMIFHLHTNAAYYTSVIDVTWSQDIWFINTTFFGVFNPSLAQVRAIYSNHSNAVIIKCKFEGNTGDYGGAVYSWASNLTLISNVFDSNTGVNGGAIGAWKSNLLLDGNAFFFNSAAQTGGAISLHNHSSLVLHDGLGGIFSHNSAKYFGGAVNCFNSSIFIESGAATALGLVSNRFAGDVIDMLSYRWTGIRFHRNSALNEESESGSGGAVSIELSTLTSNTKQMYFTENFSYEGGGIYSYMSNFTLLMANFTNNTAFTSGAVHIFRSNAVFHDFSATGSLKAVSVILSSVSFSGNVSISRNHGYLYGGLKAALSTIYFTGYTVFEENYAQYSAGAIYTFKSTLSFSGNVLFKGNRADSDGGAIHASITTTITMGGNVSFVANRAGRNGGAMYFENGAGMYIKDNTAIALSRNHAVQYGGAIFHQDDPTQDQCTGGTIHLSPSPCFIDFSVKQHSLSLPFRIISKNNSAGGDGSTLFGGLLDMCNSQKLDVDEDTFISLAPMYSRLFNNITASSDNTLTQPITSEAYKLCFCEGNQQFNCTIEPKVSIHRGEKFALPLLVLAQGNSMASSTVRAKLSSTARLLPDQRSQYLPRNCTSLTFNMYSSQERETLILYLDDSPCLDTGLSRAVIHVTFLPCPDGFTLSGDQCVCEERLQKYHANCTIFDDSVYITKNAGSKFWLSPLNSTNETYQGLILCPTCPTRYCKTDSAVNITLVNPNIQCAHNRSGLLCGACAANYSLTFGSSTCEACSNTHLALLLVFAAAGLVQVVFLTLLGLTVATGMINSVILYANIIQTNRDLFPISSSAFRVFIAWMNLDLGFQVCFYDGMDAYVQTWLQFVFPIYVWILMSLIILASRYSTTVTKLIGSNPIAVLATLLLMSYNKLLKIIIEVYSSVDLEYPGNKTVTVWLKDANEPYLQSRHLVLTVVTTLLLVFLFLPYTLLLLLGYKLYRFTGRKHTRWLTRIKPLLDTYYAPYKMHTRYWTGFLLLVRCALYIVFSYNSLGHTTQSLLAIIVSFGVIIVWLTAKVYSKSLTNTIEAVMYLNLIILSACVGQTGVSSQTLVDSLVGMVFVIMMGIIIYHFHIFYTAKSALWLKLRARVKTALRAKPTEATPLLASVTIASTSRRESTSIISILDLDN